MSFLGDGMKNSKGDGKEGKNEEQPIMEVLKVLERPIVVGLGDEFLGILPAFGWE